MDPALFPPLITGLDYDITAPLFKELYQNYSQLSTGARLRERSLFLQLAAAVCDLTSPVREDSCGLFHQKTISEAVNYIQEYYTEDISLPLLAAHSGLSQKYFGRLFREQTGYTVREYLTGVRIRNAKHLLSHTDSSLEQVALSTGFQDKFYFTKVFKRQSRHHSRKIQEVLRSSGRNETRRTGVFLVTPVLLVHVRPGKYVSTRLTRRPMGGISQITSSPCFINRGRIASHPHTRRGSGCNDVSRLKGHPLR